MILAMLVALSEKLPLLSVSASGESMSRFYKHRTFYLIAIHDEGQNSLFDTIINRLVNFNLSLYKNNGNTTQDIEYIAYKQATMQAILLKKWMREGMVVSPEKMADYFLHDMNSGHI